MNYQLPSNLLEAEEHFSNILLNELQLNYNNKRLAINLKFEGLRLMPIAFRLVDELNSKKIKFKILWSDAGSVALAKRDKPEYIKDIMAFNDIVKEKYKPQDDELLIAIAPQPYDYEEFLNLSSKHKGYILMLNGKLEDTAIGIGSIGRDRKKQFISSWNFIYSVEPITEGAILKAGTDFWKLYKQYPEGFKYIKEFKNRPDKDLIQEAMLEAN